MAVHMDDELSEILGVNALEERVWNWVRLFLSFPRWALRDFPNPSTYTSPVAARHISSIHGLAEIMRIEVREAFLPKNRFSWLVDDVRQNAWMLRYLKSQPISEYLGVIDASSFLSGRQRIITLFDVHLSKGEAKESCVELARRAWEMQRQKDKVFDWFRDETGPAGYELMWTWLGARYPNVSLNPSMVSSHEDLLSFFDQNPLGELEVRMMMVDIKKVWSQKKYRAKLKDKRQCNLILKDKTIAQLDGLAKKYDLSRAEVLEVLINAEARQEVYITQRLQRRHDLMH